MKIKSVLLIIAFVAFFILLLIAMIIGMREYNIPGGNPLTVILWLSFTSGFLMSTCYNQFPIKKKEEEVKE